MIQTPIVVKKRLQELKFTTYVLFAGVILLISLLISVLIKDDKLAELGPGRVIPQDTEKVGIEEVIDSLNIAVASYGFVINLFPIQTDMKRKS